MGFDSHSWSALNLEFKPLEEATGIVRSLENLLERLVYQYDDWVFLEVMTELPCHNYECVHELFDFQVFTSCSKENFADVVYRSLDFVLLFDQYSAHSCW